MEKYNNYDKVLNSIVNKKSEATEEEKQLLDDLEKVVKTYRANNMIESIVESNQMLHRCILGMM